MRKRVVTDILALLMLMTPGLLTACGGTSPTEEGLHVLRLATNQKEDFVTSIAVRRFAELVYEKSNGDISIEIYFNGALGQEEEVIPLCQEGEIDLIRINIAPLTTVADDFNAIQFPYTFENREHFWACMDDEEIGGAMLTSAEMTAAGLYGLTYYDNGQRSFFFTAKEVHTPADMAGLTIRTQDSQLMMDMVEAFGAEAVSLPANLLYDALQIGDINGAENNLIWYMDQRLNEYAPVVTLDEHNVSPEILILSEQVRQTLSEEQLSAIQEAADESSQYQRELWAAQEVMTRVELENKDVTFIDLTPEEKQQWIDAVEPLRSVETEGYKDWMDKIEALRPDYAEGDAQ